MHSTAKLVAAVGAALAFVTPAASWAAAQGVEPTMCDIDAGSAPEDGSPEFLQRDLANQICATQRMQDEYSNPSQGGTFWLSKTPRTYSANLLEQVEEPTRPRLTLEQWIAGGRTADPYRLPLDWESAGRGRVQEIDFILTSGAKTRGHLFTPSSCPAGGCPAIVITTGSIQGYQELYFWAAEGLAEAGYMVLTYDVQGQGRGETFPHTPDGMFACDPSGCEGVPFQQGENFYQGTRDALDFLLSSPAAPYGDFVPAANQDNPNAKETEAFNPLWEEVDRHRIGVAGHSLGAGAVSLVGQERACDPSMPFTERDRCVSAIVGWDATSAPDELTLKAPVLSLTAEYFFNPELQTSAPDPDGGLGAFDSFVAAGLDAMRVSQRSSTHLEYTYVPYILPASRYGERVAMYYTLAWFDRYLRDGVGDAFGRLTALTFDDSADASSIGAGTWDAATNRNVPYEIAGDCVANRVSIYYRSAYRLTDPDSQGVVTVGDMRARGCPGS
jgi:dienelactone hydrolase